MLKFMTKKLNKMKPLFFPFTHLSKKHGKILLACFSKILIFTTKSKKESEQALKQWIKTNSVDFIFIEDDEEKKITYIVNEYKKWAKTNQDSGVPLKTLLKDTPYFNIKASVLNIKSQIVKKSLKKDVPIKSCQTKDLFIDAMVFLRLAQENDAEKEAADKAFDIVDVKEQKLFSAIKGNNIKNKKSNIKIQEQDSEFFMMEQRILAWAEVFRKKKSSSNFKEPFVFVTTNDFVIKFFKSKAEKSTKIFNINNISIHEKKCEKRKNVQTNLNQILTKVVKGEKIEKDLLKIADDLCDLYVDIKMYFFSGDYINKLFFSLQTKSNNKLSENSNQIIFMHISNIKNKKT